MDEILLVRIKTKKEIRNIKEWVYSKNYGCEYFHPQTERYSIIPSMFFYFGRIIIVKKFDNYGNYVSLNNNHIWNSSLFDVLSETKLFKILYKELL